MSIIDEQMTAKRQHKRIYHIGLVDADLLCNGTRHPNLALLKIAGYLGHLKKRVYSLLQ